MKNLKWLIVAALLATGTNHATTAQAQDAAPATLKTAAPEKAVADIFAGLLCALSEDNYDAFVTSADANFRQKLTPAAFDSVVASIGVRLKNGRTVTFLDKLKRQGTDTYGWKMQFSDGGDELIALLALKDGKVAGFFLI